MRDHPSKMNWFTRTGELLNISPKSVQLFDAEDPFNPGVRVEGALGLAPGGAYGSMVIFLIDGVPTEQLVRGTPKLKYPFDRTGEYHFPKATEVYIYEKLDGTNVLSYAYDHPKFGQLISHKLRLAPFLRNGKWGQFLEMWREILARYPQIGDVTRQSGCNISHELYGSRNEHLIEYQVELEAAALFGVRRDDGSIVPPHKLPDGGAPGPALLAKFSETDNLAHHYSDTRQLLEKGNQKTERGKILGAEGAVCYIKCRQGLVSMWKCKPESVEAIHWAGGINKAAVMATCWNSLESSDLLDYSTLEPLLLEEYQPDDIASFRPHIEACIDRVNQENAFKAQVREAYGEIRGKGLDIGQDKVSVMRLLSTKFDKGLMTKVYSAIKDDAGR